MFWLCNILGLLSTVFTVIATFSNKKDKLLYIQCIALAFMGISNIFASAYTAGVVVLINIIKNILGARNKLSNTASLLFILFYIISGIITYKSWIDIIPIVASIEYFIAVKYGNTKTVKIGLGINSCIWLISDMYFKLFTISISDILIIIISFFNTFRKFKNINNER